MLNGQDKAKLLLSMLGDRATAVLSLLSPENATMLTSTIGDSPKASQSVMGGLISEVMEKVKSIRHESSVFSSPSSDDLGASLDGLGLGADDADSGFSSFGGESSGSFGLGGDDTADDDGSPVDENLPQGPRLRTPDGIAEMLMKEKPQVAAFVMSRFEEGLRDSVMDHLSYEFRDQILRLKVDRVPLSDSVFSKIYDTIVLAPPEEETSSEDGGFATAKSDSGSGGLFGF